MIEDHVNPIIKDFWWRLLVLIVTLAGGAVAQHYRAQGIDLASSLNAMQRGLNAEADTVVSMRDDHDAVRRSVTWSSYPARMILEWCSTCQKAQDADAHSYPQCGRCDANKDGTLSGEDIEIITQYVRARFDGFREAVDRRGATVDQLLGMGEAITESWWNEYETLVETASAGGD